MPFTQFTSLDFDEIKAQIKDFYVQTQILVVLILKVLTFQF